MQEVLAIRLIRDKLKYRIKWKGWDDDPKWYPASALRNSPLALQAFHIAYTNRPGPPMNLGYWLECAQQDTFPEARNSDDVPES